MKRIMKKVGLCLFTLVVLLGTVPFTNIKAIDDDSIATISSISDLGKITQDALKYNISNQTTAQDIIDIVNEALKDSGFWVESVNLYEKDDATENERGYILYIIDYNQFESLSTAIMIPRLPKEGEIVINKDTFPDKDFREYVENNFDNDYNDGVLSLQEISKVKTIDVSNNSNIKDIQGIEYFTALEFLNCTKTGITKLNVSNNTYLKKLYCEQTKIQSLDVSSNLELETLYCQYTEISDLNVTKNSKLSWLYCHYTKIQSLDVTKNPALELLGCEGTEIQSLDISKNSVLEYLTCNFTKIQSLDVSNNPDLKYLACDYTKIQNLDVSKNNLLTELRCENTPLAYLNIGINDKLTKINKTDSNINLDLVGDTFDIKDIFKGIDLQKITVVSGGEINKETGIVSEYGESTPLIYSYDCGTSANGQAETLMVSLNIQKLIEINEINFPDDTFREYVKEFDRDHNEIFSADEIANITTLYADGKNGKGAIKSLQGIEYFTALEKLFCYETNLTELDISNNLALVHLECGDTNISKLDVSNNRALEHLSFANTKVDDINVDNNPALKVLSCANTKIKSLNVDDNPNLESLYIRNTLIDKLDISHNKLLESLDCAQTGIENLNVSNNPALTHLYCDNIEINSLDISNNPKLKVLHCYKTKIQSLDVSNNLELLNLNCSSTQIKELDVSMLSKLQSLWSWNTKIKYLNLSQNPNLKFLDTPQTNLAYLDWGSNDLNELYMESESTIELVVDGDSFDITKKFTGIDVKKITIVSGGSLDKKMGIISDYHPGTPVIYTYDCGTVNGLPKTLTVTLNLLKSNSEISIIGNLDTIYTGEPVANPTVDKKGSTGEVTFTYELKKGNTWEVCKDLPKNAGMYRVTAHLASDKYFNEATSKTEEFIISQAANSWVNELVINDWVYGEKANPPSADAKFGNVEFTYSNSKDGIYTNQVPTKVGTWYVKAVITETENYTGLEMSKEFVIGKAQTIVSIIKDLDKVYDGKAVALLTEDLDIAGSTGNISFEWEMFNGKDWVDISSAPSNAGRYRVTAHIEESENFKSGISKIIEFVIAKATTTVNIIKNLDKVYDGKAVALLTEDLDIVGSTGDISFEWEMFNGKDWIVISSVPSKVGRYRVIVHVEEDDNYLLGTSDVKEFIIEEQPKDNNIDKNDTIQTGDSNQIILFALFVVMSLGFIIFSKRKLNKKI